MTTSGSGPLGLFATGANSQITSTNVAVATSGGNFANGVLAENGGTITLNGGSVQTGGADVVAVVATPGGTLKLTGTSVTATGLGAGGVQVSGSTASFTGSNLTIVTHGDYNSTNGIGPAGVTNTSRRRRPRGLCPAHEFEHNDNRLAGDRRNRSGRGRDVDQRRINLDKRRPIRRRRDPRRHVDDPDQRRDHDRRHERCGRAKRIGGQTTINGGGPDRPDRERWASRRQGTGSTITTALNNGAGLAITTSGAQRPRGAGGHRRGPYARRAGR